MPPEPSESPSSHPTRSAPSGWVPLALLAWFGIFATYEVVERTLLGGLSDETLHVLHIIRGTGTSFVLAGLVAWYLLRRQEESPVPGDRACAESRGRDLNDAALWIMRLRWLAIAGVLVTTLVCLLFLHVITGSSALALVLIAAAMAACNARFGTLPASDLSSFRVAFAQVFLDLAALTLMIYFTGGARNPFYLFYVFHIVIAGILLRRSDTWLVCAAACALFGGMLLLEKLGAIPSYPLLLDDMPSGPGSWLRVAGTFTAFGATAACTAYFSTRIMENLRSRSDQAIRANEALATEQAKLENLVRSVGAGLIIFDRNDKVRWSNDIAQRWFGEELGDKICRGRLWENGCASCPRQATEGGVEAGTCERVLTRDGRRKFFLVTCTPIRGAGGAVDQVLELIQDVTPMKEMEVHLVQADKMVAVGQLAAGIAHEINNPLATMASSAEILAEMSAEGELGTDRGREAMGRHLERIEANVYRCKNIVQNLLSFARREDGGFEAVDVPALLDDTVNLVEASARAREIRIARDYAGGALVLPRSRAGQIQQVVLNLLMNALDASEPGGSVRVAARPSDGGAEITVADSGHGIAPEHMKRMFEPFFTTKGVGKGTGLGLYLCHRMVEALNGRIGAESRQGEGATFRVWLPGDASAAPVAPSAEKVGA